MEHPSSSSEASSKPPSPPRKGAAHFPARAGRVDWWFVLPVGAAAIGISIWFIGGGGLTDLARRAAMNAEITTVPRIVPIGYGDVANLVSARGTVEAREMVPVPARVSGELKGYLVEVGELVEEGQILAVIDPVEQELAVRSAALGLEGLQIQVPQRHMQLEVAQKAARRLEEAMDSSVPTPGQQTEVEAARNAVQIAQTALQELLVQIERSEIALEQARIELSQTEIRAPIAGTVVSIDQRPGAILFADRTPPVVATLADLTSMTVVTEVSEADVSALDAGTETYISHVSTPGRYWSGSVRQISPRPARTGDNPFYTVRFEVDNADGGLFAGMNVQAFFVKSAVENVLVVPVAALRFPDPGDLRNATVEVVGANGDIEVRNVVVGLQDRVNAEIVSGLAEGERVVAGVVET